MNLEKIKEFAKSKHEGQFRRDNVTPYFTHCEKVASLVETDCEKAIAYCHDLIEDDRCKYKDLLELGGPLLAGGVVALTKYDNKPYAQFIFSIKERPILSDTIDGEEISVNCLRIKIADIVANLSDNPNEKQILKYNSALRILAGVQ